MHASYRDGSCYSRSVSVAHAVSIHRVPVLQVDHSIIMYLVNPRGEFVDYYGQNRTAEEMVGGIASHMIAYSRSQGMSSHITFLSWVVSVARRVIRRLLTRKNIAR